MNEGDSDKISELFTQMAAQADMIVHGVIELIYFMRGSLQYTEAMMMSPYERSMTLEFVNKRLETEAKKTNPVY